MCMSIFFKVSWKKETAKQRLKATIALLLRLLRTVLRTWFIRGQILVLPVLVSCPQRHGAADVVAWK